MKEHNPTEEEAIKILSAFDNLPLEKRLAVFRGLTAQSRENLVAASRRPTQLMRRVSEEEIYFTVKELGESDAPSIIAMTTGRQLQYIMDVDLWKKDMLDLNAASRWLNIIAATGEEKILQFVQITDSELLITLLGKFLKIISRDEDSDLTEQLDSLPAFTLDDIFFVEFTSPDTEDALKRILESIFRWNNVFYLHLMEHLTWDNQMENEDLARKWRAARLSEKGFPEFDEVLEIYQYLHKNGIHYPGDDTLSAHEEPDVPEPLMEYPLKVLESNNLFRRSLARAALLEERDRMSRELAHLANKVIIADGKDPGSMEEIRTSLNKVAAYINLALEEICDEDETNALRILQINHMELLFRRGFSLILDLRKEVRQFIRDYEGGIENLGNPLAGIVSGLLQKRPYYGGNVFENQPPREFEFLQDITSIRGMMNRKDLDEKWEPV
jgi:hypothetical protein